MISEGLQKRDGNRATQAASKGRAHVMLLQISSEIPSGHCQRYRVVVDGNMEEIQPDEADDENTCCTLLESSHGLVSLHIQASDQAGDLLL
eukprot:CAMPEP_0181472462 /NCGR_PEP_ID=MMETSP1110-20121109/39614_1 /TAXON_ID=174948 /ORGANISM="Symbiodinium sp., Strain CCMP421" /LENGTH=90 /DNA_ID=CAMNT_0023597535 /DNA_START=566 /DNA_END=838 /DNA_ORIENTATION=-